MPIIAQQSHAAAEYKLLALNKPGSGGLNLQDLDYTLPLSQSPKMLNMMYKNGVFGKRYGQETVSSADSDILAVGRYHNELYFQTSAGISKLGEGSVYTAELTHKGMFFVFNKILYFLSEDTYIQFDGEEWKEVEPYIPDILITSNPDGTGGQTTDYNYNAIGSGFRVGFNGDGSSTVYRLPKQTDENKNLIIMDDTPVKVLIGDVEHSEDDPNPGFTVDRNAYTVTFDTAPDVGTDNVFITAYVTNPSYRSNILKCKYAASYGGNNNSHLFLAGNGKSTYYYSDVFDASYFPEMNYAVIGSTEDDITGFGLQYNVLIIFKPTEVYSVAYSFSKDTNGVERMLLTSMPVNNEVGCDMPYTIQYIDNRLTWGNSVYGICTLCSTAIIDERNVRVVSRNINGGSRENGLLAEDNLQDAVALDYDGKYIVFTGRVAYMWDYTNAPFSDSLRYSVDEMAKATAWYRWDNIGTGNVSCGIVIGSTVYFVAGADVITFNNELNDFGESPIHSYYQTPLFDFQAFEALKTIKQAFFEVRGDTATKIHITYITDEDPEGEEDPEDIEVPALLWGAFTWSSFKWGVMKYAKTFARKCSIKKVMLFGVLLENDEFGRDMSLSGIKLKYTVVKEVK